MIGSSCDAAAANAATAVAITTSLRMMGIGWDNLGTVSGSGVWRATLGISPNFVSNMSKERLYHYEPGTGQRFCSMISTQKHLSGETSKSAKPGNKKNIQIDPYIFKSCSLFDLPNGWIVEKKPRKNMECAGIIDKHYFEPETGKRFHSLRSVEKYLTEGKEHIATLEALKAGDNFIVSKPSKSSSSQKEHVSRKKVETSMLDPSSIPAKIKWVLSGPGGIVWNPFMDDSLVPEFIKQKWSETFVFSIIDRL
ncbi:hypothetical protein NC651_021813 [Populus alba x Populus x berolinensis]|nr:hypothetical protein NC651_021813 [Populus alba x Populus x berolinensis]